MTDLYSDMGVNVYEADRGIERIVRRIKKTWPTTGFGKPQLDIGYFANVIDIGDGRGLATTTDGVGSKTIIADLLDRYDTIGIDCVAMNVNDLICVGATPISMVDYIGVHSADENKLEKIAIGLTDGALEAGVSITGGEVSQLPDCINGFDLVGTAVGLVDLDRIIDGSRVTPGDVIIGIESNGIHSNGLTLARRLLIDHHDAYYANRSRMEFRGRSLLMELLRPTFIYVKEVLSLLKALEVHALVNITGDGLLNLNRTRTTGVGFDLDRLPIPPAIFQLIQTEGKLDDATMYQTFNMGVGFCVIVPASLARSALVHLQSNHKLASMIGTVIADETESVLIPGRNLVGRGKRFELRQTPIPARVLP